MAAAQLASGPALLAGLEQTQTPALRWWSFAPPALLLGSAQPVTNIDLAACADAGISVYRRKSGGGAVLGDEKLLLLDLALPRDHALFLDDVTESYHWLGDVWVATLRALGLEAYAVSISEARADTQNLSPLLKPVCFGGLSPFETMVNHRKVVGLAQLRRRAGALFQCGVYLHWNPPRTAALMAVSEPDRTTLAEQLAARVAGMNQLTGREVDPAEVIGTFDLALERLTGLVPFDSDWNSTERTIRSTTTEDYVAINLL